jgi:hypothetical protein
VTRPVSQQLTSTVSLWLQRIGLGKRCRLDPLEPPNRYERLWGAKFGHACKSLISYSGRRILAPHRPANRAGSFAQGQVMSELAGR